MTGSGTLEDPYIIYDVDDLQAMENDLTAYYELANDIDAAATVGWNGGLGFDPIGDNVTPFLGNFDGKGFSIHSLTINRPFNDLVGLFGAVNDFTHTVRMQNVSFVGVNIIGLWGAMSYGALIGSGGGHLIVANCFSSGTILSGGRVGGLIGRLRGAGPLAASISNCRSSVVITADAYIGGLIGDIRNIDVNFVRCYAEGAVNERGGGLATRFNGGLVGYASSGTFSQCEATGAVNSPNGDYIGGFIGYSQHNVRDCFARGAVTGDRWVGGFVGDNGVAGGALTGAMERCYSTGLVTGNSDVGGFSGTSLGSTACFWDTQTSGMLVSACGTGATTAQMKTESTFTDVGWDFDTIWYISPPINNGYPAFRSVVLPTVTTNPATGVGMIVASFNCLLNYDGGEPCECGFEWGTEIPYAATTPTESKVTGESLSQRILGLFPGTEYHYRAFATNSAGTAYGDDESFYTKPSVSRAYALAREEL